MGSSFVRYGVRIALVLAGAAALLLRPNAAWVEQSYVNGAYPVWQRAISNVTLRVPFSLGDIAGLWGIGLGIWLIVHAIRQARARRDWRPLASGALSLLALAGVYAAWFIVSWGWNYDRAPVETRVRYDAANVNPRAVERLRGIAMAHMNALAAQAHAHSNEPLDRDALRAAWTPVIARLGNAWTANVGRPKVSIADPFMSATGTSGFINPFTLESQLATDLLWFERPFNLAHEWTHVAAFAREDEANYVAALTCTRSSDPVIAYSGWFSLFTYLPGRHHYTHSDFSPLVWQDFEALRERNARHINLSLARLSWRAYSSYLKSNHIASGVENYNEVTRLLVGIPLDREGLPELPTPHEAAASGARP
jgi:hypothetical protein